MLFGKLLPREGNFFEMFNQHAAPSPRQRGPFCADPQLRRRRTARAYAAEVDDAERAPTASRPKSTARCTRPSSRRSTASRSTRLINTMDDVVDLIQDSAETMALYDVHHMTDEMLAWRDSV